MLKGTALRVFFAAMLAVLAALTPAMAMTGTSFGRVARDNGALLPKGDLTFVAFLNGSDEVIHTENAYNSALGLGNGYVNHQNQGIWLINFANFSDSKVGDTYSVIFTSKQENLRGTYNGQVPGGLTEESAQITLKPAVAPIAPAGLAAQRTAEGVSISWTADPSLTYRVYRADLPSGADNGASRGIYNKVTQGVLSGTFVDTNTRPGQEYWYLVLAEDKNGVLSGHSGEVRVLPSDRAVPRDVRSFDKTLQSVEEVQPEGAGRE